MYEILGLLDGLRAKERVEGDLSCDHRPRDAEFLNVMKV